MLLSHVILHADSSLEYFLDPTRLPQDFHSHVGQNVTVRHPESLQYRIEALTGKQVMLDPATSNAWFKLVLQNAGANVVHCADPCLMPKAAKNATEVAGMKACHIRDGVAMAKFLSWLDEQVSSGHLHNEAILADKLESFRYQDPTIQDLSFDTISAAGPNAAMCHYNHENQPRLDNLRLTLFILLILEAIH